MRMPRKRRTTLERSKRNLETILKKERWRGKEVVMKEAQ